MLVGKSRLDVASCPAWLACLPCCQGMLSVGAALLGASHVLGLDLDPEALEVAQENCQDFDGPLPVRHDGSGAMCGMAWP